MFARSHYKKQKILFFCLFGCKKKNQETKHSNFFWLAGHLFIVISDETNVIHG